MAIFFCRLEYENLYNALQICLALETYSELGNRHSLARIYHEAGLVAYKCHEYDEAQHKYQQALEIYGEFGDHSGQANIYDNLGRVAQELREFEEAQRYYQQALNIYCEFGNCLCQAGIYHQLGIVAELSSKPSP